MSNTNVQDLVTLIDTKISAVTGIHAVYNYDPASPDDGKYPYATIRFEGSKAEFGSTNRNIRSFAFKVTVFIDRTKAGFGNGKAERLLREITDEIVVAFDTDTTLNGGVLKVEPIEVRTDFADTEIGDTRVAEYLIDCTLAVATA